MAALLKQVNTTKDVWALVQVPAVIKDEIEFLQPFDVLTLEATRDKGTVTYQIKGAGPDAAKIKDALAALDNDLKTALNEMKQEAARGEGQTAALKAGIKALEAMKLAATGKSATLDGKIEPMNLITGLLGEFPLEEWLGGEENVPDDTLPGGPNVIPPPNGPGMVPPAMPQG